MYMAKGLATGPLAIQTFYEKMHLAEGRTIYFVSFSLPQSEITMPERFQKNRNDNRRKRLTHWKKAGIITYCQTGCWYLQLYTLQSADTVAVMAVCIARITI